MSDDINELSNATYAVVDKSKKKNRSVAEIPLESLAPDSVFCSEIPVSVEDSAVYTDVTSVPMSSTQNIATARASSRERSPPKQQLISTPYYPVIQTESLKKKDTPKMKKCGIFIFLLVLLVGIVLFIAGGIALVVAFMKISKLQSALDHTHTDQRLELKLNATAILDVLFEAEYTFASCADIPQLSPFSPSGNYHIISSNGTAVRVYCDMTRTCGNITGGWMRVAELDMSDSGQCPSGLELNTSAPRTCRTKNSSSALCSSDTFTVGGIVYSMVCGRIRAYQFGTLDAFGKIDSANSSRETNNINIENNYVDGVSLTHGSPKKHIWTFAGAVNEDDKIFYDSKCPCINPNLFNKTNKIISSFVGNDYFCDTAALTGKLKIFHTDDPLWDGAGCGLHNKCCSFNTPPWFYKKLPRPTTEDIEMRVCRDQKRSSEDIAIEVVEIYVHK